MNQQFDFSAAWNDIVAILTKHMNLVLPVAGIFIILPLIIFSVAVPQPDLNGVTDFDIIISTMEDFFLSASPWFIVLFLMNIVGILAIYHLILGDKNPTVGEALTLALSSLLPLILAQLIGGLAIFAGLIFLIVPGIYFSVKFMLAGPAIAAEGIKNPIEALSRSWALTKGNSVRIFAFVLIIGIVGYVAALILQFIFGAILGLFSPTLATIAEALISGLLSTFSMFVAMAIYRQLAPRKDAM